MDARVLTLGDSAFTVEFPELKGSEGAKFIAGLRNELALTAIEGVIDLIAASRSLTVCIDPFQTDLLQVKKIVSSLLPDCAGETNGTCRKWSLPICFDGDHAPDLAEVAEWSGMATSDVVELISEQVFDVLCIGFLPGFPFMAEVPAPLRFPRKKTPRVKVPAGSIAIANDQAAIYPWESPGGWHLLGLCPVPLFNPEWSTPSLLVSGDQVSFHPIAVASFEQMVDDVANSGFDISSLIQTGEG